MLDIKLLHSPHSFAANCYLISSKGECAIIDPTTPYDPALFSGDLKFILLTHSHFDHILDIDSWASATNATVMIAEDELSALSDPMKNCYKLFNGSDNGYFGPAQGLKDNEIIRIGDCEIKFMHTPGHTVGSSCYICDNHAFVGDTVFAGGGYGRFDLPGGSFVLLKESIKKIISLPDETIFYPGHGESTTNKQYKQDIGY